MEDWIKEDLKMLLPPLSGDELEELVLLVNAQMRADQDIQLHAFEGLIHANPENPDPAHATLGTFLIAPMSIAKTARGWLGGKTAAQNRVMICDPAGFLTYWVLALHWRKHPHFIATVMGSLLHAYSHLDIYKMTNDTLPSVDKKRYALTSLKEKLTAICHELFDAEFVLRPAPTETEWQPVLEAHTAFRKWQDRVFEMDLPAIASDRIVEVFGWDPGPGHPPGPDYEEPNVPRADTRLARHQRMYLVNRFEHLVNHVNALNIKPKTPLPAKDMRQIPTIGGIER